MQHNDTTTVWFHGTFASTYPHSWPDFWTANFMILLGTVYFTAQTTRSAPVGTPPQGDLPNEHSLVSIESPLPLLIGLTTDVWFQNSTLSLLTQYKDAEDAEDATSKSAETSINPTWCGSQEKRRQVSINQPQMFIHACLMQSLRPALLRRDAQASKTTLSYQCMQDASKHQPVDHASKHKHDGGGTAYISIRFRPVRAASHLATEQRKTSTSRLNSNTTNNQKTNPMPKCRSQPALAPKSLTSFFPSSRRSPPPQQRLQLSSSTTTATYPKPTALPDPQQHPQDRLKIALTYLVHAAAQLQPADAMSLYRFAAPNCCLEKWMMEVARERAADDIAVAAVAGCGRGARAFPSVVAGGRARARADMWVRRAISVLKREGEGGEYWRDGRDLEALWERMERDDA